ncbi:MAG: hypothetical protein WBG48_03050 [Pricia sp.]
MELAYESITLFEKIYWIVAVVGSVILVILLAMTFIGGELDEVDGDVDTEIEGDTGIEFQFLSFKNLVGFFTIFGWSGIACIEAGLSYALTVVISLICGLLMMLAMSSLFYYLGKLQSSGSLRFKNALNQVGEVYLTIGAKRSRVGKVSINVQGTLREMDALTDETKDLQQSDVIIVKEVTANGILIVELLNT